jgi:uncharacterized protein YceK
MKLIALNLIILLTLGGCSGIHTIKKSTIKVSAYYNTINDVPSTSQRQNKVTETIQIADSLLCNVFGFTTKQSDSQLLNKSVNHFRSYFKANTKLEAIVSFNSQKGQLKMILYDRQVWLKERKEFKELVYGLRKELEAEFGNDKVR